MNNPRIPFQYYEFKNCIGESSNDWHTGSLHKAMDIAGIQSYNLIPYTSILPACAEKLNKLPEIIEGSVLEGIFATFNGHKGELLGAGVAYNFLYKDEELSDKVLAIAVERKGNFDEGSLEERLLESLREIKNYSYSQLYWNEDDIVYLKSVFTPTDIYGTAFAGLVFINYK